MSEWKVYENERIGERYFYLYHKSGLRIYSIPKKMATAYALLATRFGSNCTCFETESGDCIVLPDGIAHFLEHKMFENEDGSDTFAAFSKNGANANAYTSNEKTAYLFSATDRFYDSLRILLSFVGQPYFTEESVAKEQGIIAQEIRMYDDNPAARLYYAVLEGLYETHPIRINVAGTEQTISEITPQLLYDTHRKFYNLNNMALVIAGDVSHELIEKVADEVLTEDPPFTFKQKSVAERNTVNSSEITLKMEVSKPQFVIGIKDVSLPEAGMPCAKRALMMDMLNDLLFGHSAEFYGRLYDAGLLQDDFSAEYEWYTDCAYNIVCGESDDPRAVYREFLEMLERVKQDPPKREDFERIRRCNYAEYIRGFDSTEEIANSFLHYLFLDVDYLKIGDMIAEIEYGDILALLSEFYSPDRFTLAIVEPLENGGI